MNFSMHFSISAKKAIGILIVIDVGSGMNGQERILEMFSAQRVAFIIVQ